MRWPSPAASAVIRSRIMAAPPECRVLPPAAVRPAAAISALADEEAVQLLQGLVQGGEGRPLHHLLLAMAARRASHDVHHVDVEVAAVRIGGVVGERDPLEAVDPLEFRGPIPAPPAGHEASRSPLSLANRSGLGRPRRLLPQYPPKELARSRTAGARRARHLADECDLAGELVDRDLVLAELDQLLF